MFRPVLTEGQLSRLQSWTSLAFLLFLAPHLASQAAASLGAPAYDGLQAGLRRAYQWLPLEGALLGALLGHAVLAVVQLRRRGLRRATGRQRLHLAAGLFLLVVFLGHVVATRGASVVFGVFPQFDGIAFTLRWVPAYFWPYYLLLGAAGATHAALGLRAALGVVSPRLANASSRLRLPLVLGLALAVAATTGVLGLGGAFFDVGHPEGGAYAKLLVRLGFASP